MRKILLAALILLFIAGCVQKGIEKEKVEITYYCMNHPYCKVAEKYLRKEKFLKIDYCNLSDLGNCSKSAKQNMGYVFTIPTVIYDNKTFNGMFGILDFLRTLKEEGYAINVPKVTTVVDDIISAVKTYKFRNSSLFIKYLENFKNNLSETRVFFFYSPTCPHCRAVEPFVQKMAERVNVTFCNVNDIRNCSIDAKVVMTFSGIRGVPTAVVVNSTFEKVLEGENSVKELEKWI